MTKEVKLDFTKKKDQNNIYSSSLLLCLLENHDSNSYFCNIKMCN